MSATLANNSEEGFQAWESHFSRYRQLLRKQRKDPRPYQVTFKVEKFWDWLRSQGTPPTDITPYHFVCYSRALESSQLCREVESYAPATISLYLGAAKAWTHHLYRTGVLLQDPFHELQPNHPKKKPYQRPLTVEQVKQILAYPNASTPYGLRERAILELLYGSGMRCGEALSLTLESLDLENRLVSLRDTKNGWDRTIPITKSAKKYLIRYLKKARPFFQKARSGRALWLGYHGRPLGHQAMIYLAAKISEDLGFKFTTHSLRHACGTHLLEGGANVRAIAELLGHSDLASTAHYARARVEQLQRVHGDSHPRA